MSIPDGACACDRVKGWGCVDLSVRGWECDRSLQLHCVDAWVYLSLYGKVRWTES